MNDYKAQSYKNALTQHRTKNMKGGMGEATKTTGRAIKALQKLNAFNKNVKTAVAKTRAKRKQQIAKAMEAIKKPGADKKSK